MSERSGAEPGREASLAEQAAAWVPPWERARPPAPSAAKDDEPAEAPAPRSGSEPAPGSPAEGRPEPERGASEEVAAVDVNASGRADAEAALAEAADAPGDEGADAEAGLAQDVRTPEDEAADAVADAGSGALPGEPAGEADPGAEGAAQDGSAADVAGSAPSRVSGEEAKPAAAASGRGPEAALALIDEDELRGALEAIMLVVDEPVQEVVLAQVLEQPTDRVAAALEAISAGYTAHGHGFELRRIAGGWRLYTRPQYAAYVERFVLDGQSVRLTQAALETLAVIAYKQPVTRGRISAIRGVNCDGVVRTLVSRGLIEEAGTEPETGAYLYRTTTLFLEKLGLDSVDQLPDLAPFLPDDVDEVADGER